MRLSRKKVNEKVKADSPSEAAALPSEFVTIREFEEKSGLVTFDDSDGDDSNSLQDEDKIDLSPNWQVLIDGLPLLDVVNAKFSVFTVSENNTCQMVLEILATAGINKALLNWIVKPVDKRAKILFSDYELQKIEEWEATASPSALAIGDLEKETGEPWVSTLQISLKKIVIH
jgi:hypothetical protein